MNARAKLADIIDALEMAQDSSAAYLDRETGEVHTFAEDELRYAEDPEAALEHLPEWQRPSSQFARAVYKDGGKRYVELLGKFAVHEWAIMDRFSATIENDAIRDDVYYGIRGKGAFRMFKHLLDVHDLWDAWNRFKQAELRQMAIEWCEEHGIAYHE